MSGEYKSKQNQRHNGKTVKTASPIAALKSKSNLFYLLALMPLGLIAYYLYFSGQNFLGISLPYYRERSLLAILMPFYGLLILYLKKDELPLSKIVSRPAQLVGITVIVASFPIFFLTTSINVSALHAAGAIFYALCIIGLLLLFYDVSALRKSSSALFLVVAGGLSYYIGEWLEFYSEPLVPYFVQAMIPILNTLGVPATTHNPTTTTIFLTTPKGNVPVLFAAACIGIYSILAFSIVIIVTMIEEPARLRTKLIWSTAGIIGTFSINVIRVSLIGWVIYYYGYERWGIIHSWIGYTMFLAWIGFFFIVFAKRQAIKNTAKTLLSKIIR